MKNGIFIISLDFELNWGVFEKNNIEKRQNYFDNTIQVIPQILKLFHEYKISATWASVGFLFFKNMSELKKNLPENIPSYTRKKVSSYNYINNNYKNKFEKYHFAPDLIKLIAQTPGQEIASHTLSHYYCLEEGQTPKTFKNDLQKHKEIAKQFNIELNSLVFPRNQHNGAYEKMVADVGIKTIRTNPKIWFWNMHTKESFLKKVFRTADAYIPLSKTYYNNINQNQKPIAIPASRFLRPANNSNIMNRLRIYRIKKEMTEAAKLNKYYHLWWHPHNFGTNPETAISELEEILKHYNYLKEKYNFHSLNMQQIADKTLNSNA